MAYYPEVSPNDVFVPDSLFFNDIRRMLNHSSVLCSGIEKNSRTKQITVSVYNTSETVIPAGTAVNFTDGTIVSREILPVKMFESQESSWGVVPLALSPNSVGDCIVAGIAEVKLSGESGNFASPGPETFSRGTTGVPILGTCTKDEQLFGIVSLGTAASGSGSAQYTGPFAVERTSDGYKVHEGLVVIGSETYPVEECSGQCTFSGNYPLNLFMVCMFDADTEDYQFRYRLSAENDPRQEYGGDDPPLVGDDVWVCRVAQFAPFGASVTQTHYGDMEISGRWL